MVTGCLITPRPRSIARKDPGETTWNAVCKAVVSARRPRLPKRHVPRPLMVLMMLSGLAVPRVVFGQAAPPPPPPFHEGSAEFAAVATSGNTSTSSLGLSGTLIFRPEKWVYSMKAGYVQNTVDDVLKARSFFTTFRASRELT